MSSAGDSLFERVWASFGAEHRVTVSRKLGLQVAAPVPHGRRNMKTGVRLHAQVATFLSHIICIYLWLGQVARPFERRSRGGGSGGSDPTFSGLVRPCTPVSSCTPGVQGRPPDGGSLPPQ